MSMSMAREWIIFALCLGAGGHVALGVILHEPSWWPWSSAGFSGLLIGLGIYVLVQMSRILWRIRQGKRESPIDDEGENDYLAP
ncbi:hypothetical protein DNFV4_00528 [Nitrospira tepida]|uniref:Uncharacterized protein n=1 Tax=Nitrospira tepida TaxID=2973512 RepID=A0AA86MW26_9BACT|nr:hypothetical protein [Nitrospira tepida]CAI4030104.1 hypothetical protein DNFV4_00528 [Nitrospira tepida]